jgi:PIN domain nuclease of toxin-antitoxin system
MGGPAALSSLVLDTHAWVWWISEPEKLSRRQRSAIERARTRGSDTLLLSIISAWEVALLVENGRLRIPMQLEAWLNQATSIPGLEIAPLASPSSPAPPGSPPCATRPTC